MRRTASLLRLLFGGAPARWALIAALAAVVTGSEAVAAGLVYALVDALSSGSADVPLLGTISTDDGTLPRFALLAGAFFVVRGALTIVQELVFNRICYRAGADLERRLLRGYLLMPLHEQRRRGSAELVRNVHDTVVTVVEGALVPMLAATGQLLKVGAIATVMLVASPLPTLGAALVLGPTLLVIARVIRPIVHRYGRAVEDGLARSLGVATETLRLAPEVRLAGRVEPFSARFGAVRDDLARTLAAEETLAAVPRVLGETVLVLFVAGYLGVSAAAGDAADTLPTVGLFAYAALRVLPALVGVVGLVHAIHYTRPALENLADDAELLAPETRAPRPTGDDRAATVELRGVTVRHGDARRPALDGVDLTFRSGEVVALVGPNGAGKSTLAEVLTGLVDPQAGEVLVDGRPLPERREQWLANVGLVAQRVHLLDDDVRTNVTLDPGTDEGDDPAVAAAVEAAGLGEVVAGLPDGLGTVLGDDGGQLSGGERQRLAVARGLYRDAGVLLVDEGTSALDAAGSATLADVVTTPHPRRLTVVVTHDRELARRCTRVVHLERGRVTADGPPDTVLHRLGAEAVVSPVAAAETGSAGRQRS